MLGIEGAEDADKDVPHELSDRATVTLKLLFIGVFHNESNRLIETSTEFKHQRAYMLSYFELHFRSPLRVTRVALVQY